MKHIIDLYPKCNPELNRRIPNCRHLFDEYEVNTDDRFRMFIAQCAHESIGFSRLFEIRYKSISFEDKYGMHTRVGKILGNHQYGDGEKFRGRGIIQLTGRWNYENYGNKIGEDLIEEPDLAAQPYIALKLALAYFHARGVNKAADNKDVVKACKLINGGKNGLKDRLHQYKKLKGIKFEDYVK
jgi:putative chitinase